MNSQSTSGLKHFVFAACLIFTLALTQQVLAQSIGWVPLSTLQSSAAPALSDHSDGKLYAAAVNKSGGLYYCSSDSPNGWTALQQVGSGAPLFAANTAPVFVRDQNVLYLFARGTDSNIYVTYKLDNDTWSYWQSLATGGQVAGRFSAGITRLNSSSNPELHVVFKAYGDTVKYTRFGFNVFSWTPTGATRQWSGAQEGTIGTNGYEAIIAIRTANAVVVESVSRLFLLSGPVWVFLSVTTRTAEGADGHVYELSNIVCLGEAYHVAYAIKYYNSTSTYAGYAFALEHARYPAAKSYDGYRRTIASWDSNGQAPRPALCVYRNKLAAAYRDAQSYIRYARWDNADPNGPWVGKDVVAGGLTSDTPALATFNRRASSASLDYTKSNFGDDLFAAVNGYGDDAIWIANFSREISRQEVGRQFELFTAVGGRSVDIPAPLSQENRPVLTELGYDFWTLPDWFANTLFKRIAEKYCSGTRTQAQSHFGWYSKPCNQAVYPVVAMDEEKPFFWDGSIWIGKTNDYKRIWEELGHESASALGINDASGPDLSNQDFTGIPLAALQEAYDLSGQRVGTCGGVSGRCRGFTGFAGNYDQGSRQHSFLYVLYFYFSDGDQLRQWVQQDLSVGDKLLKRKYDWVKEYIFRGVEFKKDNEPLVTRPACTFTISPARQRVGSVGGTGSVSLLTQEGCNWTAKSNTGWIGVSSGLSGSGSARISFSMTQNTATATRTGTITIAGQTATVTQNGFVCVKCIPGAP